MNKVRHLPHFIRPLPKRRAKSASRLFNRHLIYGTLTLTLSLAIATVAGIFSITGFVQIFAGAPLAAAALGIVLELGKLCATAWVHDYRHNPNAGRFMRGYMVVAVAFLMIINGIGVYGFLSKAYLSPSDGDGATRVQLVTFVAKQEADQAIIETARSDMARKATLAVAYQNAHELTKAAQILATQTVDQKRIDAAEADIFIQRSAAMPLQDTLVRSDDRQGPMKYVAALVGWNDPSGAVRIIIGLIMVAFDPLAVALLVAATICFAEAQPKPRPLQRPARSPKPPQKREPLPSNVTPFVPGDRLTSPSKITGAPYPSGLNRLPRLRSERS